jgi:hypothetical protein
MKKHTKKPSKKQATDHKQTLKRLALWTAILVFLTAILKFLQQAYPVLGVLFGI